MRGAFILVLMLAWCVTLGAASSFSVATYNLENYLESPSGTRRAKSPEGKAKVQEILLALKADVLALQEMGGTNALLNLRAALQHVGLVYPHWEHVAGYDTNIHLAVLSRFPIVARRPHTADRFLLDGRRFFVSRGFAEVDIQVRSNFQFTLWVAHLKSKRPVPEADEADLRLQEARVLRDKIDARLTASPHARFVVAGDLNDSPDSKAVRLLIGRGKTALLDLRPAEALPGLPTQAGARTVTWTYFYNREDSYTRYDYLLVSPAMKNYWVRESSFVFAHPEWGLASDHRPVLATFELP